MKKQFTELIGVCCTVVLLLIGTTGAQAQYCIPGTSSNGSEWLAGVEFAGIENLTPTAPASSYTDFTGEVGIVVPGVTYEFIGTIGMPTTSSWTETITVFIDFNQDEVFDNVTERFDIGTSCNSNGCQLIDDILIPLDATPGLTRMRVMQNYFSPIIDPCVSQGFTETEDYGLLIGGDCEPPSVAFDIQDDCELFTYDVKATWADLGAVADVPNQDVTVFLTRSDIGDAGFIVVPIFLVGIPDLDVILDVPFGVTVTATIEAGPDPDCYLTRTWNENGLCPPMNNECDLATELICDESILGSTINASVAPEGIEFCNGFASPAAPAVWYTYTPETNALLEANLVPDNSVTFFDAQHFVYSGSCGAFECIDGADFGSIVWTAEAGVTYYVMVTGWGTSTGDFSIDLTCQEILCDYPDITAVMVDENGDEITECNPVGSTYNVLVSLDGGVGNDSYTVTAGGTSIVMASPETQTFGPFNSGINTTVTAVGDQDPLCGAEATVVSELCPPTNDTCLDAEPIACGETINGATLGANPLPEDFVWCDAFVSPLAPAVWYSITPETNAFVTVGLTTINVPTFFDAQHMVFSGSCGELVCIDGSDFGDIVFSAEANETYYVVVTGWGTSQGLFDITVSCDPILCEFPDVTATTVDANGDEIDAECVDFGTEYFVFVTLDNGSGNDSYDVSIGAESTTMVPGDTFTFGPYGADNAVLSVVTAGDIDSDCDTSTPVVLAVCPPDNDVCEDAVVVTCNGDNYFGSNIGAQDDVTCNFGGVRNGVWFLFNSETEVEVSLETCNPGTTFDTDLSVFTGTCGDLTCFTGFSGNGHIDGVSSCPSAAWAAGGPDAVFTAEAGVDYYILLHGFGTGDFYTGSYELSVSCVDIICSPEVTATAVDIDNNIIEDCVDQGGEYYVRVDLAGGSSNDFYNVSVNGSAPIQIAAEGTGVVGPVPTLDVANVSVSGVSQITCAGTASTSVVPCPPANDVPCGAIAIPVDGSSAIYSNVNATSDVDEPTPFFGQNQTVWFSFEGPESGRVNLSTCNPGTILNTGLVIYEVEDCGDYTTYTQLAFNDNDFTNCELFGPSIVETCVTPGVTYYAKVEGMFGSVGVFELSATEVDGTTCLCELPDFGPEVFTFADTAPICDDPENPEFSLTFYSWTDMGSSTGFIYTYAFDGGDPIEVILLEGEDPVTVPETFPLGTLVTVTVDINDPNCPGADGSIYPLSANITQDEFACDPDCEGVPGGPAEPGTSCEIDGVPGSYNADCECIPVPENDLCSGAIALECGAEPVLGSNVSATNNIGCNNQDRQTVWYTFTSSSDAEVFMTTCNDGTNFDTDINMYTGTCEEDLVCFSGWGGAGYIDGNSGCTFQSWASEGTFNAEAGVTYYIAVTGFYAAGGFSAWEGDFAISLDCVIDDEVAINGTVDGWPGTCGDRNVDVDLYTPDTDVLIGTYSGVVDAAGNFTIADLPTGTYDVIAKVDGTLAKGFADFVIVAGVNDLAVGTVQRGDVNNDNGINIIDFSLINASFNSVDGDANYNPLADLNCSGGVNILDVSILSPNFLATGATAPLD